MCYFVFYKSIKIEKKRVQPCCYFLDTKQIPVAMLIDLQVSYNSLTSNLTSMMITQMMIDNKKHTVKPR